MAEAGRRTVDYYFYGQSPFTLFGHRALKEMADRQGVALNLKPVDLPVLWATSGAVMPAQRPAVRQRYRLLELQRIADERGLAINVRPRHFPTAIALADRCTIAILESGGDAFDFVEAVGRGVWCDEADMGDEAEIAARLTAHGHDAAATIERAKSDAVEAIRQRNSEEAVAADAVGVPAYVLDGEVFWGQDRIDALERMIASGREAFRNDI